jgi:5S rRNA maturation endonuclease (ribonuclease M5)
MNAQQAKQIPLRYILAKLGYQPHRESHSELWYTSPFREESQPSFKIKVEDNVWYDFGKGQGGNVLDFVMHYYGIRAVREALRQLESLAPAGSLEFAAVGRSAAVQSPRPAKPEPEPAIELRKIKPLENRALTEYLRKRSVNVETAQLYVQEMYYRYGGKDYFALAFPNQSGGYELRNPYFKGTYGTKDITLLHQAPGSKINAVTVFEGFIDYLSALTHYGKQEADTPVIVLNSVAMQGRAVKAIRDLGAATVHLYLDLDKTGRELTAQIQEQLPGVQFLDHSGLYAGYKDINEWLQAKTGQRKGRG